MLTSMTGYGSGEASADGTQFGAEIRTVNHRFLDVRVHVRGEFSGFSTDIEQQVRSRLGRGRVDVTVSAKTKAGHGATFAVNVDRARDYAEALEKVATAIGRPVEGAFQLVAVQPDVIVSDRGLIADDAAAAAIRTCVSAALDQVVKMRESEGQRLAALFQGQLNAARLLCDGIRRMADGSVEDRQRRLKERVAELTLGFSTDPSRIAQELAMLADRADITEELDRMKSHIVQFRALLDSGTPAGRRMDFLLQEMSREANTMGAKSASSALAHAIVDLKAELERMREQVQNVE